LAYLPIGEGDTKIFMMNTKQHVRSNPLAIPKGMRRMDPNTPAIIQGGKRREGALAWRLGIGLTASVYLGPVGFILAIF
uniref:hypothetical protein n=1 Tax=Parapedobacter tibetensis TaxID=2972951 RepID=UPI00214DC07E